MTKAVVWYLNHYAGGPGIGRAYRPFNLGRHWVRAGYQVWIISASYHHLLDDEIPRQGEVTADGVNYLFIDTPRYQGNGFGRIRNMLAYAIGLLRDRRLSKGMAGSPDVIIASSPHPYCIPSAGYLARRYGCRLIVEVRDLWPASLVQLTGLSAYHPFVWFTARFERYAYRRADHLVSLIPLAEPYMREKGLHPGRFTFIPNGATIPESAYEKNIEPFPLLREIEKSAEDGYFNLCYAGAIGVPNNLELLLNAAVLLQRQKDSRIRVFVIGKGDQKEALEQKARNFRLKNISFFPAVAKHQILILLRHMDAGFISLQTKPLFSYGVSPNKLFDYMLCSLPVVFAVEAGNNPVQDAECGFSVSPNNPLQVAETIEQLASMPREQRARLGENGYRYLVTHHDYSVLAKRYMELFT